MGLGGQILTLRTEDDKQREKSLFEHCGVWVMVRFDFTWNVEYAVFYRRCLSVFFTVLASDLEPSNPKVPDIAANFISRSFVVISSPNPTV
jgi:hypothetical protein